MKLPLRINQRDSRRPLVPWLSTTRSRFDVLLFVGYLAALIPALTARRVTAGSCRLVGAFLSTLAVVDHTAFLASRGDVYGYMLAAHAGGTPLVGAQLVQLAVYVWAAVSKLGPWFQNVIQVMLSNSPTWPPPLRAHLYQDPQQGDFRPTQLAKLLAHAGTANEALIPLLLPFGGNLARIGMLLSAGMHTFIFTNFAVGVPQEWNIFTPIAVYHLFLDASDGLDVRALKALPRERPLLAAFLACVLGVVPLVGNIYPPSNSFLTSMKYYAGNWPSSIWLVRKESGWRKLRRLHTFSDFMPRQVALLQGDEVVPEMNLKVYGFRAMHLPYRGLPKLLELALQGRAFDEYDYMEGEVMAGTILGYNFGDGYLHGRFMLQAVQDVCGFERGELLHISFDSCPTFGSEVPWAVRDATALWDDAEAIAVGAAPIAELQEARPY